MFDAAADQTAKDRTAKDRTAMQRARGAARVAVAAAPEGTALSDLYQQGSARVMLPRVEAGPPVAVFINTAGGITGGDRFAMSAGAGDGAALVCATQTAERVYRSAGGTGEVAVALRAGAGARLDWLPQETILFDGGRLSRRIEADIAPDAGLLLVEAVVLGRSAMGEVVRTGALVDRWRVRRGGRLVFAEALRLDGDIAGAAARPAVLAGSRAFACLLHVAPEAEAQLGAARAIAGRMDGARAGVSAWNGMLALRMVAPDGQALRRALTDFLTHYRACPLPRVWTM
jgi:urease accessory protein